jgi:hypothetical protein
MAARKKATSERETRQNLKEVQTCMGFVEAEVIRSFLENNGIKCVFKGSGAQSILPQTTDGLGEIKIFVLENDFALAQKLLKKLEKTGK